MSTAEHYTYRVAWSPEDQEYVGTVLELPSLSWLEPEPAAAFSGIQQLARDVVTDLEESGEPVPQPLTERNYSGEFRVRIPPRTHRRLVEQAAEEHISLNRLVSDRLASA